MPKHLHLCGCRAVLSALLIAWAPVTAFTAEPVIRVRQEMSPPAWALLQRELLSANSAACEEFYQRYFDERGYLLCVERWGGDDGPDDAIENVADWPLLHALGGSHNILRRYKQAWEGHLRQYTEARTVEVPFARDGMYYKEFPVMFDWMHNGEGLRVFNLQGLSDPYDGNFLKRTRRYAGFYMNEDPGAPNYDPRHRIIRSMFNGSRGPLLRKATGLDWAGDPIEVEHRFKLKHGERSYEEMVAHFKDYNDIIGDHPQNLGATTLAANAFMATGEVKYRDWLTEYVGAWEDRVRENDGIIPTNVGLNGRIGGATEGKWYGGVYGWGFSVEVPQTGALAHRNRVGRGVIGFGNALLVTGERHYVETWSKMIDKINSHRKTIDGKVHYPRMFGEDGWYAYAPTPWSEGALECYFWLQTDETRQRVSENHWVRFLSGDNPQYPETALRSDLERIRERVHAMRRDATTPDTRLADDPMDFNPASVQALRELMLGGVDPGRGGAVLHCRLRYFDPVRRRAGIPPGVAALIDRMDEDHTRVTFVNVDQLRSRSLVVQMGAYAEHQCLTVQTAGKTYSIESPHFTVKLQPGAGATLMIRADRYVNQPTLKFPWN